jgi:V/A-type H+-transporting ATPase subunit A
MMRLLDRFFDLAEHALAEGTSPADIAQMQCVRPLQRLGEDIGDAELTRFAELSEAIDREFEAMTGRQETHDAPHG